MADIILEAWWETAIRSPLIQLKALEPLATLPASSILEDLHFWVSRKLFGQRVPELWLVSRHDNQGMGLLYAWNISVAHRRIP